MYKNVCHVIKSRAKLFYISKMNVVLNPFSPGAGTPPPALVGRKELLDKAHVAVERVRALRSEKSLLLRGLRGVGKTEQHWHTGS